jgi:hypothetical protein
MRLGVPFIAPRDLGVIRASFGRPWLPFVHGCTGVSGAHRIVNSAMATNHAIGCFPVLGWHRTVQWGAPDYLVLLLIIGPQLTWQLAIGCWHTGLSGATHGWSNEL